MGTLWRSCAKVREAIELPFGVVSGVARCTGVLDDDPGHRARGMRGFGVVLVQWFEWIFVVRRQKRSIFDSCVNSLQYLRTDNISTESLFFGY